MGAIAMKIRLIVLPWFLMVMTVLGQTPSSSIRTYDNFATLMNINPTSITSDNKATIAVRGYYTPGDGGGGNMYYDKLATNTVDDGIYFMPTNGIGRYVRVLAGNEINVLMYGAMTNRTDIAARIQKAIDFNTHIIPTVPTGKRIFIPAGAYPIEQTIHLTSGVILAGESGLYTTFLYGITGGTYDAGIINVYDNNGIIKQCQGVIIEDIELRSDDTINAHGIVWQLPYDNCEMNRVAVKGCSTNYSPLVITTNLTFGVPPANGVGQGISVKSCYFARITTNDSVVPTAYINRLNESHFYDTKFFGRSSRSISNTVLTGTGVFLNESRSISFAGCSIANNETGLEIAGTAFGCVGITYEASSMMENVVTFVRVDGPAVLQNLTLEPFRYQFGATPQDLLLATNLSFSLIWDLGATGVSLMGTSSVRNVVMEGFYGGNTTPNVLMSVPNQNTVMYMANATHITGFPGLSIINTSSPSLYFNAPGAANLARITRSILVTNGVLSGTDNGISIVPDSITTGLNIMTNRTTVQTEARVNGTQNPTISFRLAAFTPVPTNEASWIWLSTSNTAVGSNYTSELQGRYDVGKPGFSIFDPLAGTKGITTNLTGLTNNTAIKIHTTVAGLSSLEPVLYDPTSGVLFVNQLNLPTGGGGVGATNGTSVFADGAGPQLSINLADSSTILGTLGGSNWTYRLNDIDFGDITVSGSGTVMTVDSGAVNITELGGQSISGPTLGQVLTYDGTFWTNMAAASGGSGSGTNLFLNNVLLQPAKLTNSSALTGGFVWLTNAAGDFYGYATNLPAGGGSGNGTNLFVNGALQQPAQATNSSSVHWDVLGSGVFQARVTNAFPDGYYAGGFLPLYAGLSNALTGDLHFRQGDDIRVPMWETNTAFNAVGYRAVNGVWGISEFNTNDWTVLETFVTVDPTDTSGPTDYITIKNSGFNNQFIVEPDTFFQGAVNFSSTPTIINNTAFAASWDGVSSNAPSKNATYDWGHTFDTDDDGKVNVLDIGAGAVITDSGGVVSAVSTTGSGNVMRTRTGVARTISMAANWFSPEATEPASASTNQWATTTDRAAQETWDFSATSTNGVQGYFVYPMTWDAGTLNVKLYWKQVTAEANTTNVWSVALGSASDNDTMGATLGTAVTVLDQGLNDTNKIAITSWSSAITPGNSGAAGDSGTISIRRLPGHSSDNMTVTTRLLRVLMEYTESATEPTDN